MISNIEQLILNTTCDTYFKGRDSRADYFNIKFRKNKDLYAKELNEMSYSLSLLLLFFCVDNYAYTSCKFPHDIRMFLGQFRHILRFFAKSPEKIIRVSNAELKTYLLIKQL